jgi:hypothetical protein
MTYAYDLENGQRLIVQNDGDDTLVALGKGDEGQQQSQSTGFNSGKWLKPPELFRTGGNLVLRIEGRGGVQLISVRANQIRLMRGEQELDNAERLKLYESGESIAAKPMKSMKPMEPMKPMDPVKPLNS